MFTRVSVLLLMHKVIVFMIMAIAHAGLLSGFSGLESMPGPELPKIDSFARFNGTVCCYSDSIDYITI